MVAVDNVGGRDFGRGKVDRREDRVSVDSG